MKNKKLEVGTVISFWALKDIDTNEKELKKGVITQVYKSPTKEDSYTYLVKVKENARLPHCVNNEGIEEVIYLPEEYFAELEVTIRYFQRQMYSIPDYWRKDAEKSMIKNKCSHSLKEDHKNITVKIDNVYQIKDKVKQFVELLGEDLNDYKIYLGALIYSKDEYLNKISLEINGIVVSDLMGEDIFSNEFLKKIFPEIKIDEAEPIFPLSEKRCQVNSFSF